MVDRATTGKTLCFVIWPMVAGPQTGRITHTKQSLASWERWLGRIPYCCCLRISRPQHLLNSTHEGILKCVVPIDLTKCAWLVCVQRGIASWCILSWGVFSRSVCRGIVGRVWLLTASLCLVIGLVLGLIIYSFSLLIVGGKLVGMVFLCKILVPTERVE